MYELSNLRNHRIKYRAYDDTLCEMMKPLTLEEIFKGDFGSTNLYQLTIMEYTGLKDAEGTEIFEGDVVRVVTYGFNAEVFETSIVFDKAQFRCSNGRSMFYFGQSDFTKMDDAVVIGNIYEGVDGKPWQP